MATNARIAVAAALLLGSTVIAGCGTRASGAAPQWPLGPTSSAPAPSAPVPSAPVPPATAPAAPASAAPVPAAAAPGRVVAGDDISYPTRGAGQWRTAAADASPAPVAGRLLRYRVRVERDIAGVPVDGFADAVARTLDDPRGWTADGTLTLHRVGPAGPVDFTVYLATPGTRDTLCEQPTSGFTSCREGDRVVLNVARWAHSVPGYDADVATYRQYMVNHEVGHRLGHGHELCPGRGRPAPVMQQQTLGLHGCLANAWPYRDGERYAGAPGAYDDDAPSEFD